jgi:tetratricopeptide (TPR) repeat protein
MTGEVRSKKQERGELVHSLRSGGSSWVDIAEALRECYHINPRLAFRYAHGWSQERAAEEWNTRWHDELKSFKNFSHWESWPGPTGHAPSYNNLGKLAELYQCAVSDLLADLPNFRHLDTAGEKPILAKKRLIFPAERTLEPSLGGSTQEDTDAWEGLSPLLLTQENTTQVQQLGQLNVAELVQVVVMWMQRLDPSVNRRELLHRLGALFAAAATGPALGVLDPDEQQHVLHVIEDHEMSGFDEPTLRYCEDMVDSLRRQDNVLGPQFTLHSTMGHRQLAEELAKTAPDAFKQRAISVYASLTQFMGWLSFNLGNCHGAQYYYEEARSAAHDAKNTELATYILCSMSTLATSQGKPRLGLDHAAAAAVWAEESHSPLARAYAAEVAVKAYVADNQLDRFRVKLDVEYAVLQALQPDAPRAPWWYFFDESSYWSTVGQCELARQQPEAALKALDKSLALVDPTHRHNKAIRQLHRAEAYIQQEEITEATSIIGNVAAATAVGRSQRITERIASARGLLTPWQRTKPVRELDERLVVYRVGGGTGGARRG